MTVLDPARSGLPGEELWSSRVAPDGRIWTGARWPVYQQGGLGIFDPLTHEWEVLSTAESTFPSEFLTDIEFAAGAPLSFAGHPPRAGSPT